jgi:hypothetical protein
MRPERTPAGTSRTHAQVVRSAALALVAATGLTFLAGASSAVAADLPNPCTLVPAGAIASAIGSKAAAAANTATTNSTSTCSYGGLLTVQVGITALTNPAPALYTAKVAGLPHGIFSTYSSSSQTQIVFYEGPAATGLYVVVRAFAKVKQAKLVTIAKLVNAALTTTGALPGVRLVAPGG